MEKLNIECFSQMVAGQRPSAQAVLKGNDSFPNISGTVRFYTADQGTLVVAEVFNLPTVDPRDKSRAFGPFYAFHLHEGSACSDDGGSEPFKASGTHFNPTGSAHPYHAGDFPPLLGNGGYAYVSFYTGRITPAQAVGKTVIVHHNADDFHTQPSGDAGQKIACGPVMAVVQPKD